MSSRDRAAARRSISARSLLWAAAAGAALAALPAASASEVAASEGLAVDASGEAAPVGGDAAPATTTTNSNADAPAPRGKKAPVPRKLKKPRAPSKPKPILTPNTVLQLPLETDPRSFALGAHRRAVYVTDGALHNKVEYPWWKSWFATPPRPFPYAYIIGGDGSLIRRLDFSDRDRQPYGIAEGEDGRVAVTFYQGPYVEVWEPDLALKWTYHETSIHPSLPFFVPAATATALDMPVGTLAVPYDIMDRMNEELDTIIQFWLYNPDMGKRVEVFPRRQFPHVRMPHTIKMDGAGRVYAAGLQEWVWEEGRGRGMWLLRDKWANETHPVRIDVFGITADPAHPAYQAELVARWREQHTEAPADFIPSQAELAPYAFKYALAPSASYKFPGWCTWPLMDLAPGGYLVVGCYDKDTVSVLRVTEEDGVTLLEGDEPVTVATLEKPFGITRLGGIAVDPAGGAVSFLDRERKRIYTTRFPLDAAGIAAAGEGNGMGTIPVRIPLK